MNISENALNILTILRFKGIGKAWVVKNSIGGKDKSEILELLASKLKDIDVAESYEQFYKETLSLVNSYENIADGIVAIGDMDFPECRGEVKDSDRPVVLAYKGNIKLLQKQNKSIAVIGVLNPSYDIECRERKIVKQLVDNDYTIVSGLALGCDSISHTECLNNNGKTVAILPTTLKNVQPYANRELGLEIVERGGLLVTEYLNEAFSKQNFISRYIERDRLQAYFSDCVLLAASYAPNPFGNDCGSRHALAAAKNAGIKRAVMYDESLDYDNSMFDLNRVILREDGMKTFIVNYRNLNNFLSSIKMIQNPKQGTLF